MVTKLQAEARFYQNIIAAAIFVLIGDLAFQALRLKSWWNFQWEISLVPLVVIGCIAYQGWRRQVKAQWERHFALLATSQGERGLF